jgi:hypothetical protein
MSRGAEILDSSTGLILRAVRSTASRRMIQKVLGRARWNVPFAKLRAGFRDAPSALLGTRSEGGLGVI